MLLPSEVLWLILVMCCVQGSQYITVMTNTFTDLSGGFIKLGSVFTNVRRLVSYLAVCVYPCSDRWSCGLSVEIECDCGCEC